MNKTKVFNIICIVFATIFSIASLFLAALAFVHTKEAAEQLAYDDTILVAGEYDQETLPITNNIPATGAAIHLTAVEGKFYVHNPSFVLTSTENESIVVAFPDGDYSVQYDQNEGFLSTVVRDCAVTIRCVPAEGVTMDAVCRFESDDDGSVVVVGQRNISDNTALSIVSDKITDPEQETAVVNFVESVYDAVALHDGTMTIAVSDLTFTDEWSENILIDSDVLSVSSGEQTVCVAPYTNALTGNGMTDELELSDTITVMSGNYHDADTGYAPYIYKDDTNAFIVVAGGDEAMLSAFGSAELGA